MTPQRMNGSPGAADERSTLYPAFSFRTLSDQQIDVLDAATLEVMQSTGMRFYDHEALDLLRSAGVRISDGNRAHIPPRLVEWALRTAPGSVRIFNRDGQPAMWLGGERTYYGVGSDCMWIYDLESGKRRQPRLTDVADGMRLVDALPNLDFAMSMFLPSDVPIERYEAHQMATMLQETRKPVVVVNTTLAGTISAIEMAAAVAGCLDDLLARPFIINYVSATSSFRHDQESLQKLLHGAGLGLPTIYSTGNGRGAAAPVTVAGSLVTGDAGPLAGLVLTQLKREGTPFILRNASGTGALDMRSMVRTHGGPDGGHFGWDLCRHYGLPTWAIAGASASKCFDQQAAAEAALSLMTCTLGGASMIHDIGYLDSAMTGSLELVAYCDEIIGWLKSYLAPLELTEDTLALDLIDRVAGPDGSGDFLGEEHTARYVRRLWAPELADRQNHSRWESSGSRTLGDRANAKVRRLIGSHAPGRLAEEVVSTLREMIEQFPIGGRP